MVDGSVVVGGPVVGGGWWVVGGGWWVAGGGWWVVGGGWRVVGTHGNPTHGNSQHMITVCRFRYPTVYEPAHICVDTR